VYQRELSFEIPPSIVIAEINKAVKKLQKRAKIPGFRPGKAPEAMIKNRYSDLVREEVVNKLFPKYFKEAVEEHNLRPLHNPQIEDIHFEEGEPLLFKTRFEVEPTIEIKDYIGIKVKRSKAKVEVRETEDVLKNLQERAAEMISIENRTSRQGDYVLMDINWKIEGTKGNPLLQKDSPIHLGSSDNLPQLNRELEGLSIDEEKEFTVEYPQDWQAKTLAGKKIFYHVMLKEIKEKRLPPIDDNLAKDLGEFSSLEELKEKIVKDLTEEKEQKIETQVNDEILNKILEKNKIEVPEVWIRQEIDFRARQLVNSLAQQGIEPQQLSIDWEKFREESRGEAIQTVKKRMVLNQVAKQEGLKVSDEEIKAEIETIAKKSGETFARVNSYLAKEGRIDVLKEDLLQRKALDFLKDKAIIVNKGR
jgi:trigger factor